MKFFTPFHIFLATIFYLSIHHINSASHEKNSFNNTVYRGNNVNTEILQNHFILQHLSLSDKRSKKCRAILVREQFHSGIYSVPRCRKNCSVEIKFFQSLWLLNCNLGLTRDLFVTLEATSCVRGFRLCNILHFPLIMVHKLSGG